MRMFQYGELRHLMPHSTEQMGHRAEATPISRFERLLMASQGAQVSSYNDTVSVACTCSQAFVSLDNFGKAIFGSIANSELITEPRYGLSSGSRVNIWGGGDYLSLPGTTFGVVDETSQINYAVSYGNYIPHNAFIATQDIVLNVSTTGNDTTGNDTTGDGSLAAPFATIQHALNVASRYDYQGLYNVYINIANGTYTENVILPDFMGFRNNNTGSGSPNWYNGGINIIGDTVSTGATSPLVVLDGGGGVCLINTTAQIYISGVTFQATGQWSQGIWSNRTIRIGHLGWSVEGTCILHCGGSFQSATNEDMVFVNDNLYIWGFFQSWADVWGIPFDFPATGIGHRPLFPVCWCYVNLCEFW
jgi:hypothetical protein